MEEKSVPKAARKSKRAAQKVINNEVGNSCIVTSVAGSNVHEDDPSVQANREDLASVGDGNCSTGRTDSTESIDTSIRRGIFVRLHGLESQPLMNGKLGLCLYPGKDDRWVVHLDGEEPGNFRNVRQQNLEFACHGGAAIPAQDQSIVQMSSHSSSEMVVAEQRCSTSVDANSKKRKFPSEDLESSLNESLAERFAALEREQHADLAAYEKGISKKRVLDVDEESEADAKLGTDTLIQDILDVPEEALLRRLMVSSTEDLAQVLSPEAVAYIVVAKHCWTRSGGG
jgi:hypothetical protein